jgi:hypothetical protein
MIIFGGRISNGTKTTKVTTGMHFWAYWMIAFYIGKKLIIKAS